MSVFRIGFVTKLLGNQSIYISYLNKTTLTILGKEYLNPEQNVDAIIHNPAGNYRDIYYEKKSLSKDWWPQQEASKGN